MYIMLLTRVDISFTVQWLSRSLNRPIKSHLNAAKNLFKYLNSTKDYSIYFSCNGNTVADLGPKLSNSNNTTTKLSRDFHSKEGPWPLTTTSTTIVDSRNSKGSSRTSIINSSLVPIGFSDSDFAGDKATSKSTYGYLYKLAGRPISWKTKRATTIALSTLEAETNGLTEAIREVQTKYTLLKFRYVREQVKAKIVTIIYLNTKWVFYNTKTCHFIVTYIDDCLFIGPNIGYITDLKKRLNKVYAIEDLGPATYFLGMQIIRDRPNRRLWLNQSQYIEEAVSRFNLADSKPISIPLQPGLVSQLQLEEDIASHLCNSTEIKLYQSLVGTAMYIILLTRYLNSTKDYSICFSCNGNTVADLGPKLSNSSNTTTKLSRDFHSKEGPRPLTTTSTTIVDSRNSKGSSRTSIINSSLVPISWKTKRATTIALSTLEAETDGLTEAIREVQWIIGLFSELHRPIDYPITLYGDNQGSITVANDPALHARTKHTLLKFRYVREQVKAKIVTIIYLNTKFNSTGYFTAL
ncbi:hypothetical protein P8C59_003536 [Phyllachora maydis]|uniref:Reverse transcriptase Ty1/copia-type domain-containing protein n=1 Tax=Phyllachora maydis TaxID=1825666 RepID=A0AAD9I1Z1_9PEZI|nr:hypothetical protein P8C59_003536 [Phyllachora maydis]